MAVSLVRRPNVTAYTIASAQAIPQLWYLVGYHEAQRGIPPRLVGMLC